MTTKESLPSDQQRPAGVELAEGDKLLRQAQEFLGVQLTQLRELADRANRSAEEASQERRNLSVDREEINYRLRFLDDKNDPLFKKEKNSAKNQEKRRQNLLENQAAMEKRDRQLNATLADTNNASKRLSLLIRQLEIAGGQLIRNESSNSGDPSQATEENAWEVALRAQLIQGQEEERKRLAREIHDGPAQVLANAAMQLDFVGQLVQKDRPNAISELSSLRGIMRESLAEVRRFMFNLQPKMLAEQGINPTLQHYCNDFANQYGLTVELNLPDLTGLLSSNQELAAFRVVQEALNNVRKHAVATKVVVSASREPDGKVLLSVIDDGRGFNPADKEQDITRGAGLPGMRERAELIGAKLKINSKPGYGTEVCLII